MQILDLINFKPINQIRSLLHLNANQKASLIHLNTTIRFRSITINIQMESKYFFAVNFERNLLFIITS